MRIYVNPNGDRSLQNQPLPWVNNAWSPCFYELFLLRSQNDCHDAREEYAVEGSGPSDADDGGP